MRGFAPAPYQRETAAGFPLVLSFPASEPGKWGATL